MSLHDADIRSRLMRYLDRRQMPKRLDGKGGAMEDEIRALTQALTRSAPRGPDAMADWWPHFEVAIGEMAMGGLWPTEREIRDAAKVASATAPAHSITAPERTDIEIVGARMAKGEAVGEGWLYGRSACELIAARAVDEPTMRRYRSAAFLARKAAHGEASALAWEAEAKARHAAARDAFRDRTPHDGAVPEATYRQFGGDAA